MFILQVTGDPMMAAGGNCEEGEGFIGPFATAELARFWARKQLDDVTYRVLVLHDICSASLARKG